MSIEDILAEETKREAQAKQQEVMRSILIKRLYTLRNTQQPLDDSVRSLLLETLKHEPFPVVRELGGMYFSDNLKAKTSVGKAVWSCTLAHLRQSGKQELAEDMVSTIAFKEYQRGPRRLLDVLLWGTSCWGTPFASKDTIERCKQDLGWYGTPPTND